MDAIDDSDGSCFLSDLGFGLKFGFEFELIRCSKGFAFLLVDLGLLPANLAERLNRLRTSVKVIFLKSDISSYCCKSLLNSYCKPLTKSETCQDSSGGLSSLATSSVKRR